MARLPELAAAAIAATVALSMGGVGVQSLRAAMTALPAVETLTRLREGHPVPEGERATAARSSVEAGRIIEKGRYFTNAALAAGALDRRQQKAALGGLSLESVVDQAIEASPASPYNWVRRASIQLAAGNVGGARQSIETSLLLGRFVPGLTVSRLSVMISLYRRTHDRSLEPEMADQIRLAASSEPGPLAALADGGTAEGIAQRALFVDFTLYKAYLTALIAARDARKAAARSARP